jgi:hypothetical protein
MAVNDEQKIAAEMAVIEGFTKIVMQLADKSAEVVRPEVLADCLISTGAHVIAGIHGARIAAERLRQVANLMEATRGETSH